VDKTSQTLIDPHGIDITNARVDGPLDLGSLTIPYPVAITHSYISKRIDITGSHLQQLDLEGSQLAELIAENSSIQEVLSLEATEIVAE
jgi:hypothetical protein